MTSESPNPAPAPEPADIVGLLRRSAEQIGGENILAATTLIQVADFILSQQAALVAAEKERDEARNAAVDTRWFWEIVDRNGVMVVPSDERDALSRICRRLEAAERKIADRDQALRLLLTVDFERFTEHDDTLLDSVLADARQLLSGEPE